MRRLLRGLLRRGKKEDEPPPPPPPLPSLQGADADREPWTADQQRQSLFFFCLPAEIRHRILCAAFGDRTVHMDLRLRPRLYTAETSKACSPSQFHAGYPPLLTRWDVKIPRGIDDRTGDDKKPAWRWYGCVCHRNTPGTAWKQPYDDLCLSGYGRCSGYPGNVPEKCMVGAMGFLRSCKRAHSEGCLVLYQTNIVFVESAPLIDGLLRQGICPGAPRLTGPGVQLIRSLHLKLDFILFHEADRAEEEAVDRARFRQLLDLLPRAFPNLQRLQLVFPGNMYNKPLPAPMNNVPELHAVVFGPLMEVKAKKMVRLKEFSVTLPCPVFMNLLTFVPEWNEIATRRKKVDGVCGVPVWYPFEGTQDEQRQAGRGIPFKPGDVGPYFWTRRGSFHIAGRV